MIFSKRNIFYFILLLYHYIFTVISYNYFINNGGDSNIYWIQHNYTDNKVWIDFLNPGYDFICLLNYPLVKFFHLPIWVGFMLYSFIGYLSLIQLSKWIELVVPNHLLFRKINIVLVVVFLPSLNYWNSLLGKEPLIFLGITTFILEISKKKGNLSLIILSLLLVSLIRPHIAILLTVCFLGYYILVKVKSKDLKITLLLTSMFFLVFNVFILLKISKISTLDFDRITESNQRSLLSRSHSNSYVPMNEYSIFEQFFTFYFRPISYDSKNIFSTFVSVENFIILMLHLVALFCLVLYRKRIKINYIFGLIVLYYFVFALMYIQRYSILGLIVRTKIMSQPFFIVFLFYILIETYKINRVKNKSL